MKNRMVLLYMAFVFLSNFSTILYFLTVYLEFVGFSMVAISSMMIAYQVSKFILEVPTGYIADRFGRKTSGLVGVVGMLGYGSVEKVGVRALAAPVSDIRNQLIS